MMKIIFTILLIIFYSFNLFAQSKVTKEEYAVYATILKTIYKYNHQTYSNKSHFVILQNTESDKGLFLPQGKGFKDLIRDFKKKNLTSAIVEKNFPFKTYYLITRKEIDELFKQGEIEQKERRERGDYEDKKTVGANGKITVRRTLETGATIWQPFYEKFPEANGYYSLSKAGFNRNKTLAMIQVKQEDIYSGFSRTYFLKRVKGKWTIYTFGGTESIS